MDNVSALESVVDIAKEAGREIMRLRREGFEVAQKSGEFDLVTTADHASEAVIVRRIKELFPEDGILSEECGLLSAGTSGALWMADPLDGTKDFKCGGDGFSVMIGRVLDGVPVLGVVHAPATGLTYLAARGVGAFSERAGQRTRLSVSRILGLSAATQVTRVANGETRKEDEIFTAMGCAREVAASSVGLKLGLVADASADLHANNQFRARPWDTCAPQIIVEEAGGSVTDFDGNPLRYGPESVGPWPRSFVASNGSLHPDALARLGKWVGETGRTGPLAK